MAGNTNDVMPLPRFARLERVNPERNHDQMDKMVVVAHLEAKKKNEMMSPDE